MDLGELFFKLFTRNDLWGELLPEVTLPDLYFEIEVLQCITAFAHGCLNISGHLLQRDGRWCTVLMRAAAAGSVESVKQLLRANVDINRCTKVETAGFSMSRRCTVFGIRLYSLCFAGRHDRVDVGGDVREI
jgi:hypothetical protein